jgi:2,4-dienoyl-CoA reductase-like NADH-dependent reductase (Old Yellow Enzyme family)
MSLASQSVLFTPVQLGRLLIPNRFMRSATWEGLADDEGRPPPKLLDQIETLARGGVGLIVPGAVYISKQGSNIPGFSGLSVPQHARLWRPTVDRVHSFGSRLLFQLAHGGSAVRAEFSGGFPPVAPTALTPGTVELTNAAIEELIQQYLNSANLARQANADGVQLHGAHGYLLSAFLSPALNRRTDKWGGTPENHVRIVAEIAREIRRTAPPPFAVGIKMNCEDFVSGGITPATAATYVRLLAPDLDFFELSGGAGGGHAIRSNIREEILCRGLSPEEREALLRVARAQAAAGEFVEAFFRPAARIIAAANPQAKIALVGGNRTFSVMEDIVKSGDAHVISMSRPFLRDPYVVERFRNGTQAKALCINCGSCVLRHLGSEGNVCHITRKVA